MEIKDNILVRVNDEDIVNGTFEVPDDVREIGENYPLNYMGLRLPNANINKCVIKIEPGVFAFCKKLTNISIPKNVTKIAPLTFYICDNLYNMNIYSYGIFSQLDAKTKVVASISSMRNHYAGKIKYKDEDIENFKTYIKEHKKETYPYILRRIENVNFILKYMTDIYTNEDILKLSEIANSKEVKNVEILATLLNYINDHRSEMDDIINKEWNLDDELEQSKGLKP